MPRPQEGAIIEELALTEGMGGSQTGSDDAVLLVRARQGDASAIDRIYRRHRDQVYTLCLSLCGNREEAQDLLQETFVRACRGLGKFRGHASITTWLYRIAVNLAHDRARQHRRCVPESLPTAPDPDVATIDRARAALGCLRSAHRTVLALRYSQSLSYQEIADSLHWPLSRVKVTLHRAKRAFKEAYLRPEQLDAEGGTRAMRGGKGVS